MGGCCDVVEVDAIRVEVWMVRISRAENGWKCRGQAEE